jgi:GMP synthase (glutamine-hydrolysing)
MRATQKRFVRPLEGEALPAAAEVAGAVLMGGPMNVDDVARYPDLAREHEWIEELLAADVPLLGVCLGAQLLARALGAAVRPGPEPEIGWAPIEVIAADDPIVGPLAPSTTVLHWHGDAFDLPAGAELLARSARTEVQAFRRGSAYGLLFHAEADAALVDRWLSEPVMRDEAVAALGPGAEQALHSGAAACEAALVERSTLGFEAFNALVARRADRT